MLTYLCKQVEEKGKAHFKLPIDLGAGSDSTLESSRIFPDLRRKSIASFVCVCVCLPIVCYCSKFLFPVSTLQPNRAAAIE